MWLLAPLLLVSIFMRRRPLARAAVVGGAAYYAGKKGAQASAREADQEARLQEVEAQQAYGQPPPSYAQPAPAYAPPAPAPSAGGMSAEAMEQLQKLADLHTQGILTDAEFEVQKQKILQGM
jgi:hypothetical protein